MIQQMLAIWSLTLEGGKKRTKFFTLRIQITKGKIEVQFHMYNIICETNRQSRFDAWCRMLGAGALRWPRGMVRDYHIVHGILHTRILEWVAFPFSRGSSQPMDWTQVSCIAGGFFTSWATRESQPLLLAKKQHMTNCYQNTNLVPDASWGQTIPKHQSLEQRCKEVGHPGLKNLKLLRSSQLSPFLLKAGERHG